MSLRNFLRLLKDHWKLITIVMLLAGGASAVLTSRVTPLYSSSVTLYVSAQSKATAATGPIGAYEASLLSQQQVQSYADLLNGPLVAQAVIRQLGLHMTPAELSGEISTHAIPQTVLLTATVTSASPQQAQLIAQAVGSRFVRLVSTLERPPGGGPAVVHVTVVAPASLAAAPVSPRPVRNVGIALVLGLFAGIAMAAARRSLDTTIKSVDQLAKLIANKPVLGTIPFDSTARKQPLVLDEGLDSARGEAYRKLRINLQFVEIDVPPKVLLFTSALPDEGKSLTVCNMAITLARAGKRVIVVECDLRRPRATGYLGLPNAVGVTDVLLGAAAVEDATQIWGDDLFAILSSGSTPPNPSDLLGSRRMGQLIERLRSHYDLVLVDAPPVLPFADTAAAASSCDGAVIVVRHGKTRTDQVWRVGEALTAVGTPILGCVLNMTPRGRNTEYGYGYEYSYREYRDPEHSRHQPTVAMPR